MTQVSASKFEIDDQSVIEIANTPVMIDSDVATLFGISTKQLNQAIKRNAEKFGEDFAWQMSSEEFENLRSHNVTSSGKSTWGGRRTPPWVLTEHGVVMAATVLKSPQSVVASRTIVETFVRARRAGLSGIDRAQLPASSNTGKYSAEVTDKHILSSKLNLALGKVLDAIIDPVHDVTVRDEARTVALEGINALKEHLRKAGVQNESALASIRKTLKEAEAIDGEIQARHIENEHRKLALQAKQLRLVIAAQNYADSGSVKDFLNVLDQLGV